MPDIKATTKLKNSDSDLIKVCLSGDQNAWNELIDRYQRLIYSIALTLCPSPDDAPDIFQQVCLELYQRLSDLRDHKSLPAWLITVTRRQVASLLKSRKPLVRINDEHSRLETRIVQIENEYLVERAMLDLPERCRLLIDMLYLDPLQLSYAAIAKRLRMPVASIGPTRARCLAKLRKLLS